MEKGFSGSVKNAHETDALASAIYAYNDYKPLIKKINKYVQRHNKKDIKDKILMKVILEEKSIAKAVSDIEKKPEKKITKVKNIPFVKKKELTKEEKEIRLLKSLVIKLRLEIKRLEKENNKLKQKRIDIDKEIKKIISFKEKRALDLEYKNKLLKQAITDRDNIIKKLNQFIQKSKKSVIIKRLKNLGNEDYNKRKNMLKIQKEDILLVDDISVISETVIKEIQDNIKIIIYNKKSNKNLAKKFLLVKNNFDLFETKYFALINKKQLNEEIQKATRRSKKKKDYLLEILEEYRRERLKDIV
jgi:predicted RNase H-like nuclease (RuvC/YqgF family)